MNIMKQEVKVSVIVPVFNVEKYIDRCVESIVNQTYNNIEILLVDDGSKDAGGEKIDAWSSRDARIRAIHRENGGLSAARNTGIENASGDYLIFVDSDDWIHKRMVEKLVDSLEYGEIVCCGMIRTDGKKEVDIEWYAEKQVISGVDAVKLLVGDSIFTSHVQKNIFPKWLFDQVRFPEGKVYEDIRTAHKLFLQVNTVCILPDHYYYYFERSDSITNIAKLGNQIEWFDALNERADELSYMLTAEEKEKVCAQQAVVVSLGIVQKQFSNAEKDIYKDRMMEIKSFLRKRETRKVVKEYATFSQYIYFLMAKIFFYSANLIYRRIGKK